MDAGRAGASDWRAAAQDQRCSWRPDWGLLRLAGYATTVVSKKRLAQYKCDWRQLCGAVIGLQAL